MAKEVNVLPSLGPEMGDVSGVASDDEVGELVYHLQQHARAPVVQSEDQVLAYDAGVAPCRDEDAAEGMDLAERTSDRAFEPD